MFPIMHNTVNSNFGSLCVVIGRGCTKYNPRYAIFRLGFKYSPYIFLTFSGLWITDGGFYIFTLALWDFSTLSSTEKHQALHRTATEILLQTTGTATLQNISLSLPLPYL